VLSRRGHRRASSQRAPTRAQQRISCADSPDFGPIAVKTDDERHRIPCSSAPKGRLLIYFRYFQPELRFKTAKSGRFRVFTVGDGTILAAKAQRARITLVVPSLFSRPATRNPLVT